MIHFTGLLRVWPQTSTSKIYDYLEGMLMETFSLLGHPVHTLTRDIWKVDANPHVFAVVWYFNVPCHKGMYLNKRFAMKQKQKNSTQN